MRKINLDIAGSRREKEKKEIVSNIHRKEPYIVNFNVVQACCPVKKE